MLACENGQAETVRQLIKAGASMDIPGVVSYWLLNAHCLICVGTPGKEAYRIAPNFDAHNFLWNKFHGPKMLLCPTHLLFATPLD